MKVLRLLYKLNHLKTREGYPVSLPPGGSCPGNVDVVGSQVQSILLESANRELFLQGDEDKLKLLLDRGKKVSGVSEFTPVNLLIFPFTGFAYDTGALS